MRFCILAYQTGTTTGVEQLGNKMIISENGIKKLMTTNDSIKLNNK